MPVVIDTQRAARHAQRLPFCYLCGATFGAAGDSTPDHVPPKHLFAKADRNFPLVLPAHERCNGARARDDQVMCQLVGPLRGRPPESRHQRLRVLAGHYPDGSRGLAVGEMNLRAIIARWLRAFHAALYREALPRDARFSVYPPLPETRGTPEALEILPIPAAFREFVAEVKRNRVADRLDRVVCYNGHCRYESVWAQADDGRSICVWALDIYRWSRLGDPLHFEPRGCVGAYWREDRLVPADASRSTRLFVPIANRAPLDPFGD